MKKLAMGRSEGKKSVFFEAGQPLSFVRETRPVLANNLVGRLSTRGLTSSTYMLNRSSKNVGILLPLNGNPDELLFLGEIRGM